MLRIYQLLQMTQQLAQQIPTSSFKINLQV